MYEPKGANKQSKQCAENEWLYVSKSGCSEPWCFKIFIALFYSMKFALSHDSTIFPFHLVLAKILERKLEMRKGKAFPRIRTNVGKLSCSCRWQKTYKRKQEQLWEFRHQMRSGKLPAYLFLACFSYVSDAILLKFSLNIPFTRNSNCVWRTDWWMNKSSFKVRDRI